MADDFIIYNEEDYPSAQLEEDKKDFQRVQILRGRFIHYMSLLEIVMKEYCDMEGSMLTIREILPMFIDDLKEKLNINETELKKFKKDIEKISHQRDKWAHAIVWYKKRKNKDTSNNFIGADTPLTKYFDAINQRFKEIFDFLKKYDLIKLKNDKKISPYQIDDSKYNPIIN